MAHKSDKLHSTGLPGGLRYHLLPLLLLLAATLLVYGRIIGHDFQVVWDDDFYVMDNPMVYGLSIEHVHRAFSGQYFGNYAPLHLISYMLDFELWKMWAGGYLLTNLFLHAVNGLLLYCLFFRLHGERMMAAVGAAVFLLHPLQVESVAWVSQRKNLLAMLFFLLAWEAYRRYRETDGRRRLLNYCGAVIFCACALLSKSVAVIFPVVIVLYDYCFASRYKPVTGKTFEHAGTGEAGPDQEGIKGVAALFRHRWWLDKIPFVIAAGFSVVMTMQSQAPAGDNWDGAGGGRVAYHGGSPLATFYSMLPVFCRYLGFLFWPSGLNVLYNPTVYTSPDTTVVAAGGFLAVVVWLVYRLFRYDRTLAFWALVSCVAFLPVSQIVPLLTLMNDRYVYFPMTGFAALAGAGCLQLRALFSGRLTPLFPAAIFILLASLSVASFQRTGAWRDSVTLWSDSVAKSPEFASSWVSLAQAYERAGGGMVKEAIEAYQRAYALEPSNTYVLYGLGRIYGVTGEYDKAMHYTNDLLRLFPNHVMGVTQLGIIYEKQGKYDLAEQTYRRAEALQPEAVDIAMQLANLALLRGDLATALSRYQQIESRGDNFPVVAYILSWLALRNGQQELALTWLEKALQRGYADYRSIGDLEELVALRGNPRFEQLLQQYGAGRNSDRN